MRAHAGLRRQLDAELAADHELTVSEFEVLLLLSRAGKEGMRRVDLAQQIRLSPSGVTRLLDRLGAGALVQKKACSTDARATYAVITGKGRKRLKDAQPRQLEAVERLIGERLDEDEIATLADLLDRIAEGADTDCQPPD